MSNPAREDLIIRKNPKSVKCKHLHDLIDQIADSGEEGTLRIQFMKGDLGKPKFERILFWPDEPTKNLLCEEAGSHG